MNKRTLVFFIPLGVALASLALFFLAVVNAWFGPAVGTGGAFCEASREGLIKQPANTWSNLAFVIAGLVIAWQLSKDKFSANKNTITQSFFYGTFFACVVILLGPGSMAMHATEASIGGFFDMLSMYMIASFAFAYAVERFYQLSVVQFLLIFSVALVSCILIQDLPYRPPVVGYMGNLIFAFYILMTVVFELLNGYVRKLTQDKKLGYASLGTLLLACLIWNLWQDDSYLCDPQSLIQGHAMWHILDAVAAYFLFRYYASEHQETATHEK